jgi:6-phosphogluconolactonase
MNKLLKKLVMALLLTSALGNTADILAQEYFMYVGTYTSWKEGGKGIYLYRFDTKSGKITYVDVTKGIRNPSFLIAGPRGQYLFAVNELSNDRGAVSSFHINRPDGSLTEISTQTTGGDDPCHLTLDPEGTTLFTANYTGGNVSVFPVEEGKKILERSALITHEGHGPDASRQQGPHPHEVVIGPDNLLYVPDLGLDKVFMYTLHGSRQPLPADPPYVETPPGGGPRHLIFSRDGNEMYVLLEMGYALVHFHRHDPHSPWEKKETVSLLPAGADPTGNTGAELCLSPDGKYLYASNRGHNSIALFRLEKNGEPVMKGDFPGGGKTPRFFTLDPSGRFLLVLNQDSNNMALFKREKDGTLKHTGIDIFVPKPVCAVFVPVK